MTKTATAETTNANAKNAEATADAVEKKSFSYKKLLIWTGVVAGVGTAAYFLFKGNKEVVEAVAETAAA